MSLKSYLSGLVELIDVFNIINNSELIITIELVNVFNGFFPFLSKATGELTSTRTNQRFKALALNSLPTMQEAYQFHHSPLNEHSAQL
jgi:hypothetical protein